MHLRVIMPSDLTPTVVGSLRADPAATNLIVMPGAAQQPQGDVLLVDVAREGADAVLGTLRELGIERTGSIAVEDVGFSFSDAADRAERAAPGLGADSVIWDTVEQRSGEETQISITYLVLMAVATMIAGVGVIIDQPILIVGAMVVGPDFGPLAALCVGIVRGRPRIIGRSVLAIVVGFVVGMAATVGSTLALNALGLVDFHTFVQEHPNLDFIWLPDALSWVIAFLAGVAGVISLTSTKSGALVGVAISVTTVPAAANAAAALAYEVPYETVGALAQLGINIVSIVIGGVLTLSIQRVWSRSQRSARAK
ncbi:MAG TPA: DUF389 domain-containing protein [Microbacteriaceae bacterium]|jgi:uncharacterized hydrophobic protein (TIGR00271 family)|nr:DUF389 domain-containing protein [Microbacteriaceae bacterium]